MTTMLPLCAAPTLTTVNGDDGIVAGGAGDENNLSQRATPFPRQQETGSIMARGGRQKEDPP